MSEDHNSAGKFKKGNQAGSRSKRSKEIVAYIKEISNDLQDYIDILDGIVKNDKTNNRDKIACIRELLDRSLGKSIQAIHATTDMDIKIGLPKDLEKE